MTIIATDPVASERRPAADALADPAQCKVSRVGDDLSQPLTVHYRVGGTASNGVDYRALSGAVIIPANAMSAPIDVEPLDDNLIEGAESVIVMLVQPPCLIPQGGTSSDCYLVGRPGRAIVRIAK